MSAMIKDELIQKLNDHSAVVAILGLGYVGLPLAVVFAEAGFTVLGVDPVAEKVEMLQHGESYIMDVPTEQVARLVKAGKLIATTSTASPPGRMLSASASRPRCARLATPIFPL